MLAALQKNVCKGRKTKDNLFSLKHEENITAKTHNVIPLLKTLTEVFRRPLLLLQKFHGILSLKDKTAVELQFSSNSKKESPQSSKIYGYS